MRTNVHARRSVSSSSRSTLISSKLTSIRINHVQCSAASGSSQAGTVADGPTVGAAIYINPHIPGPAGIDGWWELIETYWIRRGHCACGSSARVGQSHVVVAFGRGPQRSQRNAGRNGADMQFVGINNTIAIDVDAGASCAAAAAPASVAERDQRLDAVSCACAQYRRTKRRRVEQSD